MSKAIETYLDRVMVVANRPEREATAIRKELRDHLLEKVEQLKKQGALPEDAVCQAIEENGKPLVVGYKLRGKFPLVDVRLHGTARGVVAIGPRAVGVFAFGGVALGVFAFGGAAIGLFSFGGAAIGLLLALGGGAVSPLGLAVGGGAIGMIAVGGGAIGAWVPTMGVGGSSIAVSYYTAENVPGILRFFGGILRRGSSSPGTFITILMSMLLIPLFIGQTVTIWLSVRERRRIMQADPSLLQL